MQRLLLATPFVCIFTEFQQEHFVKFPALCRSHGGANSDGFRGKAIATIPRWCMSAPLPHKESSQNALYAPQRALKISEFCVVPRRKTCSKIVQAFMQIYISRRLGLPATYALYSSTHPCTQWPHPSTSYLKVGSKSDTTDTKLISLAVLVVLLFLPDRCHARAEEVRYKMARNL